MVWLYLVHCKFYAKHSPELLQRVANPPPVLKFFNAFSTHTISVVFLFSLIGIDASQIGKHQLLYRNMLRSIVG